MSNYNNGESHPKFKDLRGKRIGSLFVQDYVLCRMPSGKDKWKWKCLCDCGNTTYSETKSLLKNPPVSSCVKCGYKRMSQTNTLKDNLSLKNRLFRHQKRGAKIRNYSWELSFEQFLNLLQQNCAYCGKEPQINKGEEVYFVDGVFKRNGIDRVDNSKGYTTSNTVPCCSICNKMKLTMSKEEFYEAIKACYTHLFPNESSTTSREAYTQVSGNGD